MNIKSMNGARISDTRDFVLSTEAPDRVGDIVKIDGLDTKNFEKNPVALYMHNHLEPIGVWSNLKKVHGALIGTLNVAAKGTSRMVDFASSMLEQGMLKAVSVSFIPTEHERNANGKGILVKKADLIEVSLVTVPMNPQALMIAKSLNLTDNEIEKFFQQPVNRDHSSDILRAKNAIIGAKQAVKYYKGN